MSRPVRVTNEEMLAAYQRTGSIWQAGKELGMAGQAVHYRLSALGHPMQGGGARWSVAEVEELRRLVTGQVPIFEIASRLDRSYAAVACKMNELALVVGRASRYRKVPRGAGYTKPLIAAHIRALSVIDATFTRYCREHALDVNLFVAAAQQKQPDMWQTYLSERYSGESKTCVGCAGDFIPTNGKQRYCTRTCATRANTDANYFGGKRHTTVGLAERICQLCTKEIADGISSHHVLGKENDPDNAYLVALCRGCHQIVTLLGARDFVNDAERWEALIILARSRKNGANPPVEMYACVEIEDRDYCEDDEEIA